MGGSWKGKVEVNTFRVHRLPRTSLEARRVVRISEALFLCSRRLRKCALELFSLFVYDVAGGCDAMQ